MKWLDLLIDKNDKFIVGKHNFNDLQINATPANGFYYFYHKQERRLITKFILEEKKQVECVCQITLIKKGEKFTPRLTLSIRDKITNKISQADVPETPATKTIRANVNLTDCDENFWKLIGFLKSLKEIEIPTNKFSLMSQADSEIVSALQGRDSQSILEIIKQLATTTGIKLSQADVNQLLHRKEKLIEFHDGLINKGTDEDWWQTFFEENKWIFGYGLNYQILRQEQPQPYYGGSRVDGTGGQRGDYLTSTLGDINFTVLVEIKTPKTPLLQGNSEIRNGAWSLSKNLTDALSQIEANIYTWEKDGSEQPDNRDRLENNHIYTVQPKGIIVIGLLNQLTERSKRETFQRFRRSLHGVDIITFDELCKRAEFIVNN